MGRTSDVKHSCDDFKCFSRSVESCLGGNWKINGGMEFCLQTSSAAGSNGTQRFIWFSPYLFIIKVYDTYIDVFREYYLLHIIRMRPKNNMGIPGLDYRE